MAIVDSPRPQCQQAHDVGVAGVDGLRGDDHVETCGSDAVWWLTVEEVKPLSTEAERPYPIVLCEADREEFMRAVSDGEVAVRVLDLGRLS
jgi:intein/homing endonuclease